MCIDKFEFVWKITGMIYVKLVTVFASQEQTWELRDRTGNEFTFSLISYFTF